MKGNDNILSRKQTIFIVIHLVVIVGGQQKTGLFWSGSEEVQIIYLTGFSEETRNWGADSKGLESGWRIKV